MSFSKLLKSKQFTKILLLFVFASLSIFLIFLDSLWVIITLFITQVILVFIVYSYKENKKEFNFPKKYGATTPLERWIFYYFMINFILLVLSEVLKMFGEYNESIGGVIGKVLAWVVATIIMYTAITWLKKIIINKILKKDW